MPNPLRNRRVISAIFILIILDMFDFLRPPSRVHAALTDDLLSPTILTAGVGL
jgi:hypothetical protein